MDDGGDLHRISVFGNSSVDAVGVINPRAGQEARDGDGGQRKSCTRIDCTKLKARSGVTQQNAFDPIQILT